MPSTYTPIASTRITNTSTASHTFSSIPGTYTDLCVTVTGQFTNTSDDLVMQFNGDTATNYSVTYAASWVTFTGAGSYNNQNYIYMDFGGNGVNNNQTMGWRWNILNYANTNMFKTCLGYGGLGPTWQNNNNTGFGVGLWRSTSAITSIKLNSTAGNFAKNTILSLYGIKAA